MKATLITAPTIWPVTVQETKEHLYIDTNDHDVEIDMMVKAATRQVENWTRRAIMTQTWEYYLDLFPRCNYIVIPFGNLQSVSSVKYKDSTGTETTMAVTTDYLVETNGDQHGRIVLPYSGVWPSQTLYPSNPITIKFICGWTTQASVPWSIKHAVKMVCAEMFELRGESTVGQTVVPNKAAEYLIASDRLWGIFA